MTFSWTSLAERYSQRKSAPLTTSSGGRTSKTPVMSRGPEMGNPWVINSVIVWSGCPMNLEHSFKEDDILIVHDSLYCRIQSPVEGRFFFLKGLCPFCPRP